MTHEYAGNIHIHSTFSDGSGSVPLIIRAGQRARLDFMIITDHRTIAALTYQGWHGGLLVLAGEELGTGTGHYLGLGLGKLCCAGTPQAMIDEVRAQGGAGFIAHPHDQKFPWPDWSAQGFDGLSLWNLTSQWRWTLTNPLSVLSNVLFPGRAATAPPAATRRKWDELNLVGRPAAAIGSSDAHAFGWRPLGMPLVVLPYRFAFRTINTHVLLDMPLTGRITEDESAILDALRRGSSFVANHLRGKPRGFRFEARGDDRDWGMGEAAPQGAVRRLEARLPEPAWIVLLRDGVEVAAMKGASLMLSDPPPGVYRVEVYRDQGRRWGWIFSNVIRVH